MLNFVAEESVKSHPDPAELVRAAAACSQSCPRLCMQAWELPAVMGHRG